MMIQHIPLTEANRRMKQIREFVHSDGLVVLTSHDKPALIVSDVEHGLRLLSGVDQLIQLLLANNLIEAARAISAAAAIELCRDHEWTQRALNDLQQAEGASAKLRSFERPPRE